MKYGIKVGQKYARADGASDVMTVIDTDTYASVDDVVVESKNTGQQRRIDCFKLARVRYYLID